MTEHHHRITIERKERIDKSVYVLLFGGLAVWWMWRGQAATVCEAVYRDGDDGLQSISYVIIAMVVQAFGGAVAALALIWSGVTFLVADVYEGVRMFIADRREDRQIAKQVDGAVVAASVATGGEPPGPNTSFADLPTDEKIKAVAQDARDRNEKLEMKVDAGFEGVLKAIAGLQPAATPTPRKRTTRTTAAKS